MHIHNLQDKKKHDFSYSADRVGLSQVFSGKSVTITGKSDRLPIAEDTYDGIKYAVNFVKR